MNFRSPVLGFVAFAIFALFFSCAKRPETIKMNSIEANRKIENGFVLFEITKTHSQGDCGFLLKDVKSEEIKLFLPTKWPEKGIKEGQLVLVQSHPSRIKQTSCFNASPIIIDSIQFISK